MVFRMTASGPVSVDPEFQYIMLLFGCTRPTLLLLIFYQSLKFHNFQWRLSILKHFFFSQNCCIGQPTILAMLLSKQHAMIINWVVLVWGSSTRTWGKYGAHGGRVQRAPITYSVASRNKALSSVGPASDAENIVRFIQLISMHIFCFVP